jgi:hypothetical protein
MPHISISEYTKLLRAEEKLQDLEYRSAMNEASKRFGNNLACMLIYSGKRFVDWEHHQQCALNDAFEGLDHNARVRYIQSFDPTYMPGVK